MAFMTRNEVLAGSYVFVSGLDLCYKATGLRVRLGGFHVGKNDTGDCCHALNISMTYCPSLSAYLSFMVKRAVLLQRPSDKQLLFVTVPYCGSVGVTSFE